VTKFASAILSLKMKYSKYCTSDELRCCTASFNYRKIGTRTISLVDRSEKKNIPDLHENMCASAGKELPSSGTGTGQERVSTFRWWRWEKRSGQGGR